MLSFEIELVGDGSIEVSVKIIERFTHGLIHDGVCEGRGGVSVLVVEFAKLAAASLSPFVPLKINTSSLFRLLVSSMLLRAAVDSVN